MYRNYYNKFFNNNDDKSALFRKKELQSYMIYIFSDQEIVEGAGLFYNQH